MGNKIVLRTRKRVNPVNVVENRSTESFEIVWLDGRSKEILLQNQTYSQIIFSLKEYKLSFFEKINECKDYLCQLRTDAKVILIINEQASDNIVKDVHNLCPIKFIFIARSTEILVTDQNDIYLQFIKVRYINLDQKSINGRFLFTQLLLDILLRMERKETDKDELIVKCTEIFANNPSELSKLQKFHMEYETEKVFEWYTKDTFIYRQLNKALCTQNIDLLFLYRFFLQDLQNQLTIHQEQSLIRTYRGQLLSKQELKDLSNAIGQYISLNSILSTTIDEQIARTYILGADNNVDVSDELPVLFEIEANPHQPGGIKPFANITARSHFPVEKEVLFMAGSIFKIKEIIYETEFTRIKLTLCSNEENQLKIVFESLRRQYGGEAAGYENEAILNSFGIVIYNMNKLSTAYRFFCRIYHETSDTNPDRIRYCLSIGNAALHLDQYEEAAQWYDRRFKLCDIHGITDAPVLGNLHLTRGNLYTKLKKRERALESYEEALAIFKKNFGENHLLVAICYSSIAIHFERRKYYSHSVELRQKALDIAEKTLPPMHPNLALYHAYLSQLLFDFKHRDLTAVLDHAQKAFDIGSVVFQPNDEQLFNIYCMLCEIHSKLGDFKESMAWLNKIEALEDLQLTDIRTRKITYMCKRCLQVMWIYRYFRWMKNTRFNCFIFHVIPGFYQSLKRNLCNY